MKLWVSRAAPAHSLLLEVISMTFPVAIAKRPLKATKQRHFGSQLKGGKHMASEHWGCRHIAPVAVKLEKWKRMLISVSPFCTVQSPTWACALTYSGHIFSPQSTHRDAQKPVSRMILDLTELTTAITHLREIWPSHWLLSLRTPPWWTSGISSSTAIPFDITSR